MKTRVMSPRRICLSAIVGACLVASTPVAGQRIIGEVRLGTTVGSHTATAAGLELLPGPSLGVLLEVSLNERVGVYAGFVQTSFGCESGFCINRDVVIKGRSAAGGIALRRGWAWTRIGLLFGVVEPESEDSSSAAGFGLDGVVGVQFRVGPVIFTPGAVLRRHDGGGGANSERAASLGIDVGIAFLLRS
ncbi:MAG TPA: hypothetical protein DC060_05855 [Gemmatimonadetes bacterium]|nr:hypothetical protein [Gemmatimonadota bacterium]